MNEEDKLPTIKWYTIKYIDNYTAELWYSELTGRRVGKQRCIKTDLPSIIQALWAKLCIEMKEM